MSGTVYVVDDDKQMRKSLLSLLEANGYRTRGFPSAEEFLQEPAYYRPGCALIDVRLDGMSGLQLPRHLPGEQTKMPFVFISGCANIRDVVEGMREGAIDFLEKPCPPDRLLQSIDQAIAKDEGNQDKRLRERRYRELLTQRERQVIELLADGQSVKQIASTLGVSYQTVNRHRSNALGKLGVDSVLDLVRMWSDFLDDGRESS